MDETLHLPGEISAWQVLSIDLPEHGKRKMADSTHLFLSDEEIAAIKKAVRNRECSQ